MSRIRTIKPEFPLSETMGRVSREARLLFILLWTVCDDEGRFRATSRVLASLLYPFDDDANKKIDGWIRELESQDCIVRYEVDGSTYGQVCKWLKHQKIDRPSPSKLPPFDENHRVLASPREPSMQDLGSRTLDLGPRTKEVDLGSCSASGDAGFAQFWEAFDYKKGRAEALTAWKKIKVTDDLLEKIMEGARREASNRQAIIARGSTPIYAQGWLTRRRWEDEHVESRAISSREAVNRGAVNSFLDRVAGGEQ